MPTFEIPQSVQEARLQANSAMAEYSGLAKNLPTIGDTLRTKLNAAYEDNKDIIEPLDKATSNYYAAPASARLKYQAIRNPFEREALVSEYTQNKAVPMMTYSGLLGHRQGNVADFIKEGTNAYESAANQALMKAEQARQAYTDSLGEFELLQSLQDQAARLQLQREQFSWDKQMDVRRLNSGGGSGSSTDEDVLVAAYADKVLTGDIDWTDAPSSIRARVYARVQAELDNFESEQKQPSTTPSMPRGTTSLFSGYLDPVQRMNSSSNFYNSINANLSGINNPNPLGNINY